MTRVRPSPQIQFLEEVIALVVDDDEGREILDLDAPDRFHAEFGIFHHLDLLDAVLGEVCRSNGDDVAWKVSITNPMPLTLAFTGTVSGDSMTGEMGIGPMGSFPFTGTRAETGKMSSRQRPPQHARSSYAGLTQVFFVFED